MRIDDVVRGAAAELTANAARDVDTDEMFRSLQRTRVRRRITSNVLAACVVVLLSFGAWTVAGDVLNPQSAPVPPSGPPPTPPALPGAGGTFVRVPAGTYAVVVNGSQSPGQRVPVVRVPTGYTGGGFAVNTEAAGMSDARGLSFWAVRGVFTNPCTAGRRAIDPGSSIADLAQSLAAQPMRAGTDPVPVTVDGYRGLYVETSVPAHIHFTTCKGGSFDSWTSPNGDARYQQGPGQQDLLWILDVEGHRMVIDGWHMPGATKQQVDQITRMVKTLTFQTTG